MARNSFGRNRPSRPVAPSPSCTSAKEPDQVGCFRSEHGIHLPSIVNKYGQLINAPTLVMIGDRDIVRPEHAVLMFRLLPNAQLAVLPGTDHMTIVNRSDWLVSMIESFLDSPMPLARQTP